MSGLNPERWAQLWRAVGGKIPPAEYFQKLVELYSEPHRHYHNQHHIVDCLGEFDRVKSQVASPVAVELAIWFHDAIYDTHAADNEENSAVIARRWVSLFSGNAALTGEVSHLVMATKNHDASPHPDAPLLVDIDLSILGQPPARFWDYEKQIRAEYDWVDAALFATKRAEILQRFLARPRIYQTAHYFERLEALARENLKASVERLGAGHLA